MTKIIKKPVTLPYKDGNIIPVEEREEVKEKPSCLGSKHFDFARASSGELVGPCYECILWRACLAKRTEK